VSPVTAEGRIIAVFLMLTGIGVIGIFTATVASLFVEQESGTDMAAIDARLKAIEHKLEALLAREQGPTRQG
jgi:voltage-gated potassium channel